MPPLVLLAGGASARMGAHKGLLAFHGRPWLEAQLDAFARAGGREAIVVVSALERYRAELPWIDGGRLGSLAVRTVHQPRPEEGPFSSLRLGLAHAPGAFVLPIDVPARPATFVALYCALGEHDAAVPRFEGRRGHPVLLSPAFARRLIAIQLEREDARLDRQLARCDRAEVALDDPWVTMNLNTKEAWERFSRALTDHS